jgi:lysozyme
MNRSINRAGLELVKRFEGFYSDAYLCPAGVWTIGYGHTAGVYQGQTITEDEAEHLLAEDLGGSASDVERLITVQLSENQFAALVSFTFNVGGGNLQNSTLRRKLNTGDYEAVPFELNRWVKATDPATGKKVTLPGLVRRRAAEAELWLTPNGTDLSEDTVLMPQRVDNVDGTSDSRIPVLEQVRTAMEKQGYKIFDGRDSSGNKRNFDLNIFGIRTLNSTPGAFDDWLGVFWMNWDTDDWEYHIWNATTDPGQYWLTNPLNVRGTAILTEGQHRSCYQIGLHKSKYEALVQSKPLKVYRDNDRDEVLDRMPDTIQRGMFGINIHRASADHRSIQVGKWSAGCQVVADPRDFARLMDLCELAEDMWGPTFSYTLLAEEQLSIPETDN